MIIGKRSVVEPGLITGINDSRIKTLFSDRSMLHANRIPEFSVYIDEPVWNQFLKRADNEYALRSHEASGIILGHYFSDQHGKYVVGTHFEAGYGEGTTSVFCEISVQDQLRIVRLAKDQSLLQLIWIHSHPSFGAFYSSVDYRTLKSMYYAPHQVGIVVDNVNWEYMGFKVKDKNACEFKDIYIVSIDNPLFPIARPFGKSPNKNFYLRYRTSSNSKTKTNSPVSLKDKKQDKIKEWEVLVSKTMDKLKLMLKGNSSKKEDLNVIKQNWELEINEIEILLNEKYGENPYMSVALCFTKLEEMRSLLKEGVSSENQVLLLGKMKDLINNLPS